MNAEFADDTGEQIPVKLGTKRGFRPLNALRHVYRRLR